MTLYLLGSAAGSARAAIFDHFCSSARKRGSRVLVVATADDPSLPELTDKLATSLPEHEHSIITLGQTSEIQIPDDTSGIIVANAAPTMLVDELAPHKRAIADRVRRGVPFLGVAGGASIIGSHVITGGWRHDGRQVAPEESSRGIADLTVTEGLSLIGPIIETDGDTNSTLQRSIAAIESSQATTVASLDHDAGMSIDVGSGRTRVYGDGRVTWVSAAERRFVVTYDQRKPE